jgi:hypothetical protein
LRGRCAVAVTRVCDPPPRAYVKSQGSFVGGLPRLAWAPGGEPRVAYVFTVSAGRIAAVELVADPARIQQLNIVIDE